MGNLSKCSTLFLQPRHRDKTKGVIMPETFVDSQEVIRNIDRISGGLSGAMKDGLDVALIETQDFIKVEYSRPATGKGFTDRTANLRNSISHDSWLVFQGAEGVITADMPYAEIVETRYEGKFAYLWPGTVEKGDVFLKTQSF